MYCVQNLLRRLRVQSVHGPGVKHDRYVRNTSAKLQVLQMYVRIVQSAISFPNYVKIKKKYCCYIHSCISRLNNLVPDREAVPLRHKN